MSWLHSISLVSPWTLVIVGGLCLTTIALIVRYWAALATPGWKHVLARIGSLLLVGVLLLATGGVALNKMYVWYASVGDLLPVSAEDSTTRTAGANARAAFTAIDGAHKEGNPPRGVPDGFKPVPNGSGIGAKTFEVVGHNGRLTGKVNVWLPAEYESEPDKRFPVIFALPGIPTGPDPYLDGMPVNAEMEALVESGEMRSAIIVTPSWNIGGLDNECVSSPRGGMVEEWLADDIPAWLHKNFRVTTERDGWVTWGYSAGGWCANLLTMHHPETFSAAVSFGAYWYPVWDAHFVPVEKGSPEERRLDLERLAREKKPPVALWSMTGSADPYSTQPTFAMLDAVSAPTSVTVVHTQGGGHVVGLWNPFVVPALQWLGTHSPAFGPDR